MPKFMVNLGCGLSLLVSLIGVILIAFALPSAPVVRIEPTRISACLMAQDFVKRNLKAPATAQFPRASSENCQATRSGNSWTVRSYVDAQNGYGAMIRSDFEAEMDYRPNTDDWYLVDLTITGR